MAPSTPRARPGTGSVLLLAGRALRTWTGRQVLACVIATTVVAIAIGMVTVLIPNPVFGRDIPPVWWNYPVWLATSALTGMLVATYVAPHRPARQEQEQEPDTAGEVGVTTSEAAEEVSARRSGRMGMVGGTLAWFAVGCPVCNKLALVALGYSGALTWYAPLQPVLALGGLSLTGVAVLWRLRGQVACPVRREPVPIDS